MTTTLDDAPPHTNKNWYCIVSTFIISGGFLFFGVSITLKGDQRTGLVLLLSCGGLLSLFICAAVGKCRPGAPEEDKPTTPTPQDPEDRPPSYRLSWRRSFMRHIRRRNDDNDEEEGGGGGGVGDERGGGGGAAIGGAIGRGGGWWQRRGKEDKEGDKSEEERQVMHASCPGLNEDNTSSSCDSLLAMLCQGAARDGGRCTQSLSDLLDPPSYQEAFARLDDASVRKLHSELCLNSVVM